MLKIIPLILKGFVLGLSMILPGISGGTMAFIMGIYGKLIEEISKFKALHLQSLLSCLKFKRNQTKQTALLFSSTWDWAFLLPLMLGAILAIGLFIALAFPLIEQYRLQFYSLIFGLVLASLFLPFKKMKKTAMSLSLLFLSFVINAWIFALGKNLSLSLEGAGPLIFLPAGLLVSSALIVPGLSGSYLLVLFGLYEKTLLALKNWDFFTVFCFFAGGILGGFSIAKSIHYLLKNHFNETIAVILGLILSSLYIIYPLSHSARDLLAFDSQTQTFLLYSVASFAGFMALSLFYEKKSNAKSAN